MRDKIDKLCYLKAMDLFRGLTDEDIASLDNIMRSVNYTKGQILYSPGETREVLFFLKKGSVQLYHLSPDGKKLVITVLGPNSFFGEMSLVGQRMYDTFAEVEEDSVLCVMTREDTMRLLSMKPAIAINLVEILGKRLLETETILEDLAFKNVRSRLASLLLRIAEQRKGDRLRGVRHQDLAERMGVLRETVTNTLAEFKADRLVELGWRKIVILNEAELRRIAAG